MRSRSQITKKTIRWNDKTIIYLTSQYRSLLFSNADFLLKPKSNISIKIQRKLHFLPNMTNLSKYMTINTPQAEPFQLK